MRHLPKVASAAIAASVAIASAFSARAHESSDSLLSVKEFGVRGDCVSDDAPAIVKAIAASNGRTIFFPSPTRCYLLRSSLGTIPRNTRLQGANKQTTKLQRGFHGSEIMALADGVSLDNLYLEGDGKTFTGKGIVINGTAGNQNVTNSRIINFRGSPVEFASTTAGSRSNWVNLEVWQTDGVSGSDKYAFVNADSPQLLATPKSFVHIETSGNCSFSFGGSNNVYIANSFLADLRFSPNTRGVMIVGSRIANQRTLAINGHNNSIVGSDVLPIITIVPGATTNVIGPGSLNPIPAVIDRSGNNTNLVTHAVTPFAPVLAAAGTSPGLGNGRLTGSYLRQGGQIFFTIELTIGTTTSLGTGELRFALPVPRVSASTMTGGNAIISRGGALYTAMGHIPAKGTYISLVRDGSGFVTATSPSAFTPGDTILITGAYFL
jgi:hypothetical protein